MTPLLPHAAAGGILAAMNLFDDVGIAAAILLALTGMALQWRVPQHRMSVEERMKDGDLSEEEARRQIRFYAWCAPLATILGVVVLVLVLYDLA